MIKIIPAILATVGIVLCQVHGAPFWIFIMAGNLWLGLTISILWEGMSVWLWWEGSRWFWKWIPTVFLLFGMVFQSVSPMVTELEHSENKKITQRGAAEVLDKLMVAIVDQERRGFKDTLDNLIKKAFIPPKRKKVSNAALAWLPAIPAVGFPIIYILCLLFVSGLRERVPRDMKPPETDEERLAGKLKAEILKRLKEPDMTYRELGRVTGVPFALLNNIALRDENKAQGKTVVGMKRMREIEKLICN